MKKFKKEDITSFFTRVKPSSSKINSGAEKSEVNTPTLSSAETISPSNLNTPATSTAEAPLDEPLDAGVGAAAITPTDCEPSSNIPSDLGTSETGPAHNQARIEFPKTTFGTRNRSFSSQLYDEFKWVEYSVEQDKIYCFVCRQFYASSLRKQSEKFIHSGFNKWKKTSEALRKHQQSDYHISCNEKYLARKVATKTKDVHEQVQHHHDEEVVLNRNYLEKQIDIILCLASQGLPFRGHREGEESSNKGNFLALGELLAKYDEEYAKNFKERKYCSPEIQNQLIDTAAELVLHDIAKEVEKCGFFSLSADEARCHKEQQLSVSIRYVIGLEAEERFLGFIDCSKSRDAASLKHLIISHLEKCGLSEYIIIGQSYDGASVMSGKHEGLQAQIQRLHPLAVYVHCLGHRVNLIVVDACSQCQPATRFFNAAQALYKHFSNPDSHSFLKDIYHVLGITFLELTSLSSTRWPCRFENCRAIKNNYDAIVKALRDEIEAASDSDAVTAEGILTQITKPEFVVCLFVFHSILSKANILSKYFQGINATLGRACSVIEAVITEFESARDNFDPMWSEIVAFCTERDIPVEGPRNSTRRKMPRRMDDFFVMSSMRKNDTIELPPERSAMDHWKVNVYLPVMDAVISGFKKRFQNLPFAKAIDKFWELDLEGAKEFVDHYKDAMKVDIDMLQAEVNVMKNVLQNRGKELNFKNLKTEINEDFMPNLYKLLQVSIGLSISSANCERSFSAMRRIKTWLRTTMMPN